MDFKLVSKYSPCGDQPQAIQTLTEGINNGLRTQVLRGVTGSGKTFTMANIIAATNRPAIIISRNEFREFFPHNRVEFFVSYYDYYLPESYIPSRDLYIEKELSINDEIDKLRHSATCSLFERRDTIVVASVSCIYGLGAPGEYYQMSLSLRPGDKVKRNDVISKLVEIQYKRNDMDLARGTFRVRGDILEIFPAQTSEKTVRIEFFGDEVERITENEAISGKKICELLHCFIFPATHYIVSGSTMEKCLSQIQTDKEKEVATFEEANKAIEAYRLNQRVNYDLEMLREMGYTNGIENYSRYFDGRKPGQPPYTLLDYFPEDFITFIDESHITLPQIRGMYNGDRSRKDNLVGYGFRLKSAYDNRPLKFEEFDARIGQMICVSATPNEYELKLADQVAEQIIRPTGLLDPVVAVKPVDGQIEDLIGEINSVVDKKGRVLITTLTKRMAESLTEYLSKRAIRVRYMHSDIDTLERVDIINSLKEGEFDVLVGINLLREGLDLPQVQLVAILDADKEGFLRSVSSLIQTIGRAARNEFGRVVMYADTITGSMKKAIEETERRRKIQDAFNRKHGIIPKTIVHDVKNTLIISQKDTGAATPKEIREQIEKLNSAMKIAAGSLDFERAIQLREQIARLTKQLQRIMEKHERNKNKKRKGK